MNKIIVVICIFTIAFISFSVGYKVGDSRGYNDGYNEGYLYDCRAEIGALNERVKAQKKATEWAEMGVKSTLEENARLRKRIYSEVDSIKFLNQRISDSVNYAELSKFKNDSILTALGRDSIHGRGKNRGVWYGNFITPDGRVNGVVCMMDKELGKLPECTNPGWRAYR